MTVDEFKFVDPENESILIMYSGSVNAIIQAVNISNVDCRGVNISEILQRLTELTLTIDNNLYECKVGNRSSFPQYTHFTIDGAIAPTSTLIDRLDCADTYTVPSLDSYLFSKSEYQAIQNNASVNRSVNYIFDVDRKKLEIPALNIDGINNGTATLAEYQEYNYASIGIRNSRYDGAKTSEPQYGVSPAFSGISVNGALYTPNQSNEYICSQSLSDRNVEEVIVGYDASASPSFAGSAVYAEDISINYETLAKFIKSSGTIDASATTLNLNAYIDIYPGDIIRIKLGTPEEILKVVSVSSKTSSSTVFTAIRAYKSDINPDNTAVAITGGAIVLVSRLSSTTVFKADGNQLYKVSNRKLWVEQNTKVFYIDEGGKVIFELITCSI